MLADSVRSVVRRAGIPSPLLLATVSGSLLLTMVMTSGLGAVFWWIAARLFTPQAVGIAAGSVSAMTLLGTFAMAGAGTLLVRELPRNVGDERSLVWTASVVTVGVGTVLAVGYALAAPLINPALAALGGSPVSVALFASGVVLTIVTSLSDYSLLAMLRASLRLARNAVFATSKLVLLVPAAAVFGAASQRSIYGVWILGSALSLALVAFMYRRVLRIVIDPALIPRYARPALMHFALSMGIAFPSLVIPVLVALMGSPVEAAQFYIAWMLASVAYYPSVALTQSLFALAGRAPHDLWRYARTTMATSFAVGAAAVLAAFVVGGPILGLFGPAYREVSPALPMLMAVAIPQTIKDHYQTISRLHGDFGHAVMICGVGGAIETLSAALGMAGGGVIALAAAWLVAVALEGIVMVPLTLRVARQPLSAQ